MPVSRSPADAPDLPRGPIERRRKSPSSREILQLMKAAIQALFEALLPGAGDLASRFLYAIVVTVAAVLVTIRLGREEPEEE